MILLNWYGRATIVNAEDAKRLLVDGRKFELYMGQDKNKWGAPVYGLEAFSKELIDGNIEENRRFNQNTIKFPDKYGKRGEPVRDAWSASDEKYQEDDGIFEWEIDFEQDKEDNKVVEEAESVETKTKGVCKRCGEAFERKDRRYKICPDCK